MVSYLSASNAPGEYKMPSVWAETSLSVCLVIYVRMVLGCVSML